MALIRANAARLSKLPYSRRQLCLRCGMGTMACLLQQVRERPEVLHRKRHSKWGVSTRPFADLTAPLAPGRAGVPARRCPRLSGRGSLGGFA